MNKLKSITNQVKDDEMPLASYDAAQKARLSKGKSMITDWAQNTKDSLEQIGHNEKSKETDRYNFKVIFYAEKCCQ